MIPTNLSLALDSAVIRAERLGAIQAIDTTTAVIEEDGVSLHLLTVTPKGLSVRKPVNRGRPEDHNPFLPYEQDLFVANLGVKHVAILNKFPVTASHLLLITRAFEEQRTPLTQDDFLALALAMSHIDGLALFNGGPDAGASQRHKHLQLIAGQQAFIEPWLVHNTPPLVVSEQSALQFRHAYTALDPAWLSAPDQAANCLLVAYRELLARLGYDSTSELLPPYNLLATRRWMLAIPRSRTFWNHGDLRIAINAITFSGSVLLYDERLVDLIRHYGLRQILSEVT